MRDPGRGLACLSFLGCSATPQTRPRPKTSLLRIITALPGSQPPAHTSLTSLVEQIGAPASLGAGIPRHSAAFRHPNPRPHAWRAIDQNDAFGVQINLPTCPSLS